MFVNFFNLKFCRQFVEIPQWSRFVISRKKIPIRRPFPLKFNESPDHTRHSVPFSLSSGCIWFSLSYLNGSSLLPQFSFLSNRWRGDRDSIFCVLIQSGCAVIWLMEQGPNRTPGRCFPPTKKKKEITKRSGNFFKIFLSPGNGTYSQKKNVWNVRNHQMVGQSCALSSSFWMFRVYFLFKKKCLGVISFISSNYSDFLSMLNLIWPFPFL